MVQWLAVTCVAEACIVGTVLSGRRVGVPADGGRVSCAVAEAGSIAAAEVAALIVIIQVGSMTVVQAELVTEF